MSYDINEYFETALSLTKIAGKLIRERITQVKKIEEKSGVTDLVTETDLEVEQLLINGLKEKYPNHKFIGEESTAIGSEKVDYLTEPEPIWIIDPVDGTMNFIHSFPHCCISIALAIKQSLKIGIIYNPVLEQLFTAKENQGAFLNGEKINASGLKDLSKALLVYEVGTSLAPEKLQAVKENIELIHYIHGLRSLGSAALDMAMVAQGAADCYVESGIHIWDIAAGIVIVREAGGVVLDPNGGPLDILSRRVLCASTDELAQDLAKKTVQFYPTPRD